MKKALPRQFYKYFWDTDPALIDMGEYPQSIIERILEWGRPDDLRLLIAEFGREQLKAVLMRSRQLTIRNANFLATIWEVPKEEVLCLQPESRRLRKAYWNR